MTKSTMTRPAVPGRPHVSLSETAGRREGEEEEEEEEEEGYYTRRWQRQEEGGGGRGAQQQSLQCSELRSLRSAAFSQKSEAWQNYSFPLA